MSQSGHDECGVLLYVKRFFFSNTEKYRDGAKLISVEEF